MRSSQVADNNQKKHVLLERFRLGIRGRILLISSILIVMMLMMTLYLLDKLSNSLENNMEFHVKSTRDNIFRNLASIQSQSLAYARMLSSIDLIKSSIDNRFIGELQKQIKPVIKDLHVDLIAVYDRDGQELVKVESDEAQEVSFQVESVDKKGNKLPALNFGVTPGDFQADYRKDFLNFLKYLQQNVGYQFRLIVSQDYFSLARDIARGYIHVGWMPPAAYVTAREAFKDNVVYLASARGKEEKYYRGYIAVRADSKITSLSQLKGKIFAFVDPESSSGYKFPYITLFENGIDPSLDFSQVYFMGTHENVVRAIIEGKVDAGAIFKDVFNLLEDSLSLDNFRILKSTDPIPQNAVVASATVDIQTRRKLRQALVSLDEKEGQASTLLKAYELSGFQVFDDSFYDPIKKVNRLLSKIKQPIFNRRSLQAVEKTAKTKKKRVISNQSRLNFYKMDNDYLMAAISPVHHISGEIIGDILVGYKLDRSFYQRVVGDKTPLVNMAFFDDTKIIFNTFLPGQLPLEFFEQSDQPINQIKTIQGENYQFTVGNPFRLLSPDKGASMAEAAEKTKTKTKTRMVLGINNSELSRNLIHTRVSLLLGTLIIVIITIFMAQLLASQLYRPIAQLMDKAELIGAGALNKTLEDGQSDTAVREIRVLGKIFEKMRISLKERIEEIGELNRQLESKVKKRTQALEKSKNAIEKQAKRLKKYKQKIREDLKLARKVQKTFLPKSLPKFKGLNIQALYIPSEELSGDFYQVLPLDDKRLLFCTADVSGHGISSAFVTTLVMDCFEIQFNQLFQNFSHAKKYSLANMLENIHRELYPKIEGLHFVTMFLGIIDLQAMELRYSNSGAPGPVLYNPKSENLRKIFLPSLPLGAIEEVLYEDKTEIILPNDRISIVSDGVIECSHQDGNFFGFNDYVRYVSQFDGNDEEFISGLINNLRQFNGKKNFYDDITAIYFSVSTPGA